VARQAVRRGGVEQSKRLGNQPDEAVSSRSKRLGKQPYEAMSSRASG
jgi:hypothetical protein